MVYKLHRAKPTVIFLAEDDEDDIFLFQEAMVDTGIKYELHISRDGNELMQALEQFYPAEPDIIFMDINMPKKRL
jgi:CheY-like chemotaxis protein